MLVVDYLRCSTAENFFCILRKNIGQSVYFFQSGEFSLSIQLLYMGHPGKRIISVLNFNSQIISINKCSCSIC